MWDFITLLRVKFQEINSQSETEQSVSNNSHGNANLYQRWEIRHRNDISQDSGGPGWRGHQARQGYIPTVDDNTTHDQPQGDHYQIFAFAKIRQQQNNGYIEGSTLIPFADFLTSLDQVPAEKDARIVIYCASGHRGSMAEMALYMLGYTNVSNLGGGIGAWKTAGLPVAGWVDWAAVTGEFVTSLPADQGFYSISAAPLNQLLAETPPFLVDVREITEVEASGYIAGAINIPIRELLNNLDMLPAQDQKIVIYCASGHRGGLGMMALRLLGYTDVVNLGGGTGAWTKAQFALTAGLPAAPVATGAVPTIDPLKLTKLNEYLMALPAGFNGVKAPDLNAELAGATAPVVLDVRSAAEVSADGYIEGALLIPIVDLPASLSQLPADKAAPIVVACKSGHRGAVGMMYLNFLGYTNVRNLGGGMGAWIAAALPVVK